jgi:hypothetical protein
MGILKLESEFPFNPEKDIYSNLKFMSKPSDPFARWYIGRGDVLQDQWRISRLTYLWERKVQRPARHLSGTRKHRLKLCTCDWYRIIMQGVKPNRRSINHHWLHHGPHHLHHGPWLSWTKLNGFSFKLHSLDSVKEKLERSKTNEIGSH